MEDYAEATAKAIRELLQCGEAKKGEILVAGCNTGRVCGGFCGRKTVFEIAGDIAQAMLDATSEAGLYLAAQCGEQLDRALVLGREAVEKYGLDVLQVLPDARTFGAFSLAAYKHMKDPLVVRNIQAQWGLDIGQTMIGMHLAPIATTIDTTIRKIGAAPVTAARSRPLTIQSNGTL